jgi:ribosomal-protein-serine acetyltransferase
VIRIDLGEGVELREWVPEDAEEAFAEVDQNRDRLRDWLPWVDATRSPDDVRAFIERCAASDGRQRSFGIYVDDALAGNIGLTCDEDNGAEIGYWIAEPFQGRGLVTRAARAMLRHAFLERRLRRVQLTAATDNDRSRAVAERLGMTREGVLRQAGRIREDRYVDLVMYSILREEWERSGFGDRPAGGASSEAG